MMLSRLLVASLFLLMIPGTKGASQRRSSTKSTSHRLSSKQESSLVPTEPPTCTGEPTVPSHRRACNFYVWDFTSALLYKWCHHLLKDHIYEGRGGRMFVRYESNSILQLLYPCSRYSPNRCLVCGGSFPDHLELWWSASNLYSPFDLYLDSTYKNGRKIPDESAKQKRQRRRKSSRKSASEIVEPPTFGFHRSYVHDVSDMIRETKGMKNQLELLKQKIMKETKKSSLDRLRLTQFPQYDIAYLTPQLKPEGEKKYSLTLRLARALCLNSLQNLIILQEKENERLRNDD